MQHSAESAARRLERLWQYGSRPDLREFLAEIDPQSSDEILDLLRVDQQESWQHGERRPAEDYLLDCPSLRAHADQLLDLVRREIELRQQQGEGPRLEEYQDRFPDLAHLLEQQGPPKTEADDDTDPAVGRPPLLEEWDSIAPAVIPESLRRLPETLGAPNGDSPPPLRTPPLPSNLPGYEILRELGRGGMGVVYLARQKGLHRLVALKMLLSGSMSRGSDLERFRSEAAALARLQHPGIIQIYEIGEHDGLPFFSLEFAAGGSLDDRLRRSPQPAQVAAELMVSLAQAVHAAHQAGVIHRDLKPANILLSPLGKGDEEEESATIAGRDQRDRTLDLRCWLPKITDFGLAKCLDVAHGQTQTGDVMGTPCYMAPEQAEGNNLKIGPCSDLYTLGAILYELLTGRPPFLGENSWDTLNQVITQEPVPPRSLQPGVPRDLETICLKCLEKDPLRRYRTAAELTDDLQRFREGRPILARPVSVIGRGVRLVKRRPMVSALAFLVALAATGAAALYVENLRQEKIIAERDRDRLLRTESDREKVRGLLQDAETALNNRRLTDAESLLAPVSALLDGNPDLGDYQERAKKLQTEVRGRAQATATLQKFSEHCEDARFHQSELTGLDFAANVIHTRSAARAALALVGMDESRNAPALNEFFTPGEQAAITADCYEQLLTLAAASAQAVASKGEEPGPQAAKALEILARAERMGRSATRALHIQRAQCLAQHGEAAAAVEERRLAEALAPTETLDFFLLGLESYRRRDYEEALKRFAVVLAKDEHRFWPRYLSALCHVKQPLRSHALAAVRDLTICAEQRPTFAWIFLVRGHIHAEVGDYPQAERDYQQAQASAESPDARYTLFVNRGVLRIQQKRLADAVADFEQAISIHPMHAQAHLDLARAYQEIPKPDRALAEYAEALRAAAAPGAAASPRFLASVYRTRAALNQQLGKTEAALEDYAEAARRDARSGDLVESGRLLIADQKYDKALSLLDDAVRLSPDDGSAHHLRGLALLELRRPVEALAALDRSLEKAAPTADVYELRGRVKALAGDHVGAIDDYTQALSLRPSAATHSFRGWAYLVLDAPRLAVRDFDEVVKREPKNADAFNGRGTARVKLGSYRLAVKDAEEAARLDATHRVLYKAARVVALASSRAESDANEPNRAALAREFQDRAAVLLRQSLETLPRDQRGQFWHEQVRNDTALVVLYRNTEFLRLKGDYGAAVPGKGP